MQAHRINQVNIQAKHRTTRLLVLVTSFLFTISSAIFAAPAFSNSGLSVTVYDNLGENASPPLPGEDKIVHTTTVQNIDEQWFDGPVAGSDLAEDVVVKYEGYITVENSGPISFYANADDGVYLYLDDQLVINDWYDKGCCGNASDPVDFQAYVPKKFLLYFYENGGGAFIRLNWDLGQGDGFEIIPPSAFETKTPPVIAKKEAPIVTPKGLTARSSGSGSLTVQWMRPPSSAGKVLRYEIYRNGVRVGTVAGNKTSFRDKGLESTQSYSYRIVLVTAQGRSAKSSPSSAMYPRR